MPNGDGRLCAGNAGPPIYEPPYIPRICRGAVEDIVEISRVAKKGQAHMRVDPLIDELLNLSRCDCHVGSSQRQVPVHQDSAYWPYRLDTDLRNVDDAPQTVQGWELRSNLPLCDQL